MEKTKTVVVRANPAGHHERRHCAQRAWTRDRVTVKVVDSPKASNEISPSDLAELIADPHLVVVEQSPELTAALAKVTVKKAELDVAEAALLALEQIG